jgi:flavin-dependent dehydrogenase
MSLRRIVIVGAGPAGLATARAYREHGGVGEVVLSPP